MAQALAISLIGSSRIFNNPDGAFLRKCNIAEIIFCRACLRRSSVIMPPDVPTATAHHAPEYNSAVEYLQNRGFMQRKTANGRV